MSEHDDVLQIRTFATPDEIWNLEGFKPDNPINNQSYDRIIGDYWFPDEVKCCFQKENGNLCHEDHKWGFIARLIDGSITIVGNNCAINKFGADSKMKADRSRYLNEKRRREAYTHVTDILASKAEITRKLHQAVSEARALKDQVSEFTSKLGQNTLRRLEDMYRTGNSLVTVQGISYREYIDDEGEKRKERTVTEHSIGRLAGLSCLSAAAFSSISKEVQAAESAFTEAERLKHSATIRQIKSVISGLKTPNRVEELVETLKKDVEGFLSNDLLLFCFLTGDKSERYRSAQLALEQRGEYVGKDKAKIWLAEQEYQLASSLGVDKLDST